LLPPVDAAAIIADGYATLPAELPSLIRTAISMSRRLPLMMMSLRRHYLASFVSCFASAAIQMRYDDIDTPAHIDIEMPLSEYAY